MGIRTRRGSVGEGGRSWIPHGTAGSSVLRAMRCRAIDLKTRLARLRRANHGHR